MHKNLWNTEIVIFTTTQAPCTFDCKKKSERDKTMAAILDLDNFLLNCKMIYYTYIVQCLVQLIALVGKKIFLNEY